MKYQPGESGNTAGRPKGALGKRNQLPANLVAEALKQLRVAVDAIDLHAVKLVIERAYTAPKIRSLRDVEEPLAVLEASLLPMGGDDQSQLVWPPVSSRATC